MLKNYDHVGFTVSDLDCSLAFYRDLLGLKMEWSVSTKKSMCVR